MKPVYCLLLCVPAWADVSLPALFSDHMMIQRKVPVHVWGRAAPGEDVAVTFRSASSSATADSLGYWSVRLPAVAEGGPFTLTVKGANVITLNDVLVGDVWVASGQSNMEMRLRDVRDAATEIAASNEPKIRFLQVANQTSGYPLDDVQSKGWSVATPETSGALSAVGYFFARDLVKHSGVPIGILSSSWGGTPQEAWISLKTISGDAALMPVFASWAKMNEDMVADKLRRQMALKSWQESADRAKAEGKPAPGRPYRANVDAGEWAPGGLYNAMIAPLTRFPIRGVIWYQGESNADAERVGIYGRLIEAMIQDWRKAWGEGDFPFLLVQLAGFKNGNRWPEAREAQRKALSIANTGLAVAIDIGEATDIHPKNKQDVGKRLALIARAMDGEKIEYSGPLFRMATPESGAMRVQFDHAASGLVAKNGSLRTFEVAGADRKFVAAEARVDGTTVVVSSAAVPSPMYVRYGWSDFPDCNLYNADGLPASPFQSEK